MTERFAIDPNSNVTSVYETVAAGTAQCTVRWRGVSIGFLVVDEKDLPALRDLLLPGGTEERR